MERICPHCDNTFVVPTKNKSKAYCDNKCYLAHLAESKPPNNNCKECDKEIYYLKKFCNRSCSATYNNKLRSRSDAWKIKISESLKKYNDSLTIAEKELRSKKHKLSSAKKPRIKKPSRVCATCGIEISSQNKYEFCKQHYFESDIGRQNQGNHKSYRKGYVYNRWTDSKVYLMSGMEFEYFEYLEKNNIEWKSPETLCYVRDGIKRKYHPDFYLVREDCFIEIKGHWWNTDRIKMDLVIDQNPDKKIIIIQKKDLKDLKEG